MPACTPELRNFRKEKWLKVYSDTFNRAEANRATGLNRATLWRWLQSDRAFANAVWEIEESLLDTAESELMKLIKKGSLPAITFLLRKKGHSRGYADRLEIEKSTRHISIDSRKVEILLSDARTREALEIIATSIVDSAGKDLEHERKAIELGNSEGSWN